MGVSLIGGCVSDWWVCLWLVGVSLIGGSVSGWWVCFWLVGLSLVGGSVSGPFEVVPKTGMLRVMFSSPTTSSLHCT